ncbi:hypothetical protein D3C75_887420 [compost metagenome]
MILYLTNFEPILKLYLMPYRYPVISEQRNRWLQLSGFGNRLPVHSNHVKSSFLIKADRPRIVIGGYQPHLGTAKTGCFPVHQLNQLRAGTKILLPAIQGYNFAHPVFTAVINRRLDSPVRNRAKSG